MTPDPRNAIRRAVEDSMQDIGLGTDERLERATARIEAAIRLEADISDAPRCKHVWVLSREVFWDTLGGDFRTMWCDICGERPKRGCFPIVLAEEAGKVTPATPLV